MDRRRCCLSDEDEEEEAAEESQRSSGSKGPREIFRKAAALLGPSFIVYRDESASPAMAKLVHQDVEANHVILGELKACNPSLSFKRTELRAAINAAFMPSWKMTKQERDDWQVTMLRRAKNVCRVVAQGELKNPRAAWVKRLPWNRAGAAAAAAPAASTSIGGGPTATAFFGYDEELMVGWRQTADASGHLQGKEPSKPLVVPETTELNKHDGIIAEWPDGVSRTIPGMTVKRFNELKREKKNVGCGVLWQGSQKGTGHKIWVAQRVDRHLLMVVMEQMRLVCCCRMSVFGEIEDEHKQLPLDDPITQKALELQRGVAMKYAAGLLAKEELYPERDRQLALLGLKHSRAATKTTVAKMAAEAKAKASKGAKRRVEPKEDVARVEEHTALVTPTMAPGRRLCKKSSAEKSSLAPPKEVEAKDAPVMETISDSGDVARHKFTYEPAPLPRASLLSHWG